MIDSQFTRMPLVSVIITNRNYKQYVCQAIRSVADQTYKKFECVIIDDCSIDGSFETINEFLLNQDDSRFRCIRLGQNLGQMAAIKAGLENTSGEFIASLDADDLWMPDFLKAHIAAHLNASFSAGISASDTVQIDGSGTILEGTFHTLIKHRTDFPNGHTKPVLVQSMPILDGESISFPADNTPSVFYVDRANLGWHYVAMSSFMFRRSLLDLIIPKETSGMRLCADYYLAVFCHWITGSLTIGRVHSFFRMHRNNHFSSNSVLGGSYPAGNFSPALRSSFEKSIADHIIDNIEHFQHILGLGYCLTIIKRAYEKKDIYKAVKHSPLLRLHLGRGSDRTFRLKYRMYRLIGKR
jgi:glycosyltransferase involved in cell wall biosynthesis